MAAFTVDKNVVNKGEDILRVTPNRGFTGRGPLTGKVKFVSRKEPDIIYEAPLTKMFPQTFEMPSQLYYGDSIDGVMDTELPRDSGYIPIFPASGGAIRWCCTTNHNVFNLLAGDKSYPETLSLITRCYVEIPGHGYYAEPDTLSETPVDLSEQVKENGQITVILPEEFGVDESYSVELKIQLAENASTNLYKSRFGYSMLKANGDPTSGVQKFNIAANEKTYSEINITRFEYITKASASGDSPALPLVEWEQSWGWSGRDNDFTESYHFEYENSDSHINQYLNILRFFVGQSENENYYGPVYFYNRETTEGEERGSKVKVRVRLNDKIAYATTYAYQEANVKSWKTFYFSLTEVDEILHTVNPSNSPASGASFGIRVTYDAIFTSGKMLTNQKATDEEILQAEFTTDANWISFPEQNGRRIMVMENRGTTIGPFRTAEVSCTMYGITRTYSAYDGVSQVANAIKSYNYGAYSINLSLSATTISRAGGTITATTSASRSKTPVYTSGAIGTTESESGTVNLSVSGTGFSVSGNTITVAANTTASARTGTVTATCAQDTSKRATATITQEQGSTLEVSPTTLTFGAAGGTLTFNITSNDSWTITEV